MNINIRPVRNSDIDELTELMLLAFAPVFASFREILGSEIYEFIWPDWKASKKRSIEKLASEDSRTISYVAEFDETIVGLISYKLDYESKTGTLKYLAVHPDYQRKAVGTELNKFALKMMKDSGMEMASAETGGDDSHLPARNSYEKAGYTGLPLVRYFKKL
jgi:ribosomal protein S18 acetylase RimI-like enzyme